MDYAHALFLEQYSGNPQKAHSGQFKKQQFAGNFFPGLLFRRVCAKHLRGMAHRGLQQGQGVIRPVAVDVFRPFVNHHPHIPGAGIQPHAVGIGGQGGFHSLHGRNGLHQGGFGGLRFRRVIQVHMVGFHLHESDIAQVHIGRIENQKTDCHQEELSRCQHPAVLFEQRAKTFSHQDNPLPVYWMNISSSVGSWEWMLMISSWAKGMPASSDWASMVFDSRCPWYR